jgi:hypothetical protein
MDGVRPLEDTMRYGPLFASVAVLLGLAACKGNDSTMNADLAKDLASAKSNDALALAPRVGVQTVVSAQELSPQGRSRLMASSRSSHTVAHRTPHHTPHSERIGTSRAASEVAAAPSVPISTASAAPDPTVNVSAPSARPQPVEVSYPSTGRGEGRTDGGGATDGMGGLGAIIGAIGGVVLRGGTVDGDHCDPRSHRGGGILINRRGPILRGTF